MELPHVISAKDFTRAQLDALFEKAKEVKSHLSNKYVWTRHFGHILTPIPPKLSHFRTMALLFDQPSLRTSSSFETAMYALGGNCVTYRNASRESSIAKDESLQDTIEMLSGNPGVSVLVLRHPEVDAARRAAAVSSVPIINAGDGTEHPTQALVDLFTIQEALGSIEGKTICFVGDMHARTAKSLLYALTLYSNLRVFLIFPPDLGPDSEIVEYTEREGIQLVGITLREMVYSSVAGSRVLYVLRPQQENWYKNIENPQARQKRVEETLRKYYRLCTVNNDVLANMPENSIVLHPRPRGPELPTEVDSDPRVLHATQGRNGGPVRMALLEMMHSGEWQKLANK